MQNPNKIIVKNFPKAFSTNDKRNFLIHFGAIDVQDSNNAVIAEFKTDKEAEKLLQGLHQKEILGKRLTVEYFTQKSAKSTPESQKIETCHDFVLKWLSLNPALDFNQPPPPYLRYKYPQPTREIIDSICVALESVPKFYTQVLHLMNKMNLPPPFTPAQVQESLRSQKTFVSSLCQTEISNVRRKRRIWSGNEVMSDESEMESDEETKEKKTVELLLPPKMSRKSKKVISNPAKRFLATQNYPKTVQKEENFVFEGTRVQNSKTILIKIPSELPESSELEETETHLEEEKPENVFPINSLTRKDLAENRLTLEQLQILPVFKNYAPGERSNKLYIKNLAKNVTTEDLEAIFHNFTKNSKDEIEIKLMQSGRMKGQAFVTFNTPYDEKCWIDMALQETNGFMLKDKPMVVMYGKGS